MKAKIRSHFSNGVAHAKCVRAIWLAFVVIKIGRDRVAEAASDDLLTFTS